MKAVGQSAAGSAQHMGIGKKLLAMAADISQRHGSTQIAVISGIGVRGYYKKNGYELLGSYMIKQLPRSQPFYMFLLGLLFTLALLYGITFLA
jgi:elongator complex protein 3